MSSGTKPIQEFNLVLLRHGESVWNAENRFTGWTDVDLTQSGITQCLAAADILRTAGFIFDVVFTSLLKRCVRSVSFVQERLDQLWVPVIKTWELNERHYGALQGLNKAEVAKVYGEQQASAWRKSFATRPPLLGVDDPRHPVHDFRFHQVPNLNRAFGESLADTLERVYICWDNVILPELAAGKSVLILSHGNTLRSLISALDSLTGEDVINLHVPTGVPIAYEIASNGDVRAKKIFAKEVGQS